MAQSTCIKCGGTQFEAVPCEPKNSGVKIRFIQCASCGGVIGTMDWHPLAFVAEKLVKSLGGKMSWK